MRASQIVNYFFTLLVICNPLLGISMLLALMQGRTLEEKRRTALITGISVAIILVTVTWIGIYVLEALGIRLESFQVAGGFIVFMIALSMLQAQPSRMKQSSQDQREATLKESIAVVPLAIPVLAGPGAIGTVIVAVSSYPGIANHFIITLCAILVALVLVFVLYFANPLEKMLGQTGINLVNRISGLILAAMAIDMLASGIAGLFPALCKL